VRLVAGEAVSAFGLQSFAVLAACYSRMHLPQVGKEVQCDQGEDRDREGVVDGLKRLGEWNHRYPQINTEGRAA
jgi:hypothetical protein